jgi:hypothetical protein
MALDTVGDEELSTIVSPHLALDSCRRVCPAAGAGRRRDGSRCDKLDLGPRRIAQKSCIDVIQGQITRIVMPCADPA